MPTRTRALGRLVVHLARLLPTRGLRILALAVLLGGAIALGWSQMADQAEEAIDAEGSGEGSGG